MEITFVSVFILCLLHARPGQSQDNLFEDFTEDVMNKLSTSDFLKLFKLSHDSVDQVKQALTKAGKAFASTLDTSVPEGFEEKFDDRAKKFASFSSEQFFNVYAKALADTLGDQGVLYSGNEEDLANSYANKLQDAANSLDGKNVMDTLPAVANASANVLKDNGFSGLQLIVRNFDNNLLQEIDMEN